MPHKKSNREGGRIMKRGRVFVVILTLLMLCSSFAFAGTGAEKKAEGDFVIGISNSLYGNIWREKMLESMAIVADFYIEKGMLKDTIVQQSGPDVQTQIQQIRNMISQGVDMILINPASATGLTGVIEEANDAGIPSIVFDAELLGDDRKIALSVATDKFIETYRSQKYLAERMGGKGNVVVVLGNAAYQPSQKRYEGTKAVLKEFPGLKELTVVYGEWNQATAEAVMNDVVATYPKIDAIFTTGAMGMGALRAFINAGRPLPAISGDPTVEGMLFEKKLIDQGKKHLFANPLNPPGIGGTALAIGVYLLHGYEFKDGMLENNVFYYPLKTDYISRENLDEFLKKYEGQDPSIWISEWADDATVRSYFK
jgi:ribose transport system substrate-binding protein